MASPNILNATEFADGLEKWQSIAQTSSVNSVFTNSSGQRYTSITFPLDQVVALVSTVGARQIKARFVLDSTLSNGIIIVLFAADAENNPLSAYYYSFSFSTAKTDSNLPKNLKHTSKGLIPNNLAEKWINDWADTTTHSAITAAMFDLPGYASNNPLWGYNFTLQDFVSLLDTQVPISGPDMGMIGINFGLHTYYSAEAGSDPNLTITCGLVLRVYDKKGPALAAAAPAPKAAPDDAFFYDLSMPCPPNT